MSEHPQPFPFAAIVGQEALTSALLLCAVNPGIGGVLIRGDKGSAKSTAARALTGVLSPIERIAGCAYNCEPGKAAEPCETCRAQAPAVQLSPVPFVNLPLGATEDRVLGSLDFERALKEGRRSFQPGLLAAAHRGILYIDEVNLLPDHLVDVLLDSAAMGVNRVQREGLSVQHPTQIALIGTMNPEEGDIRPQLLDRFGMMVEVTAPEDARERTEIVRRRLAWEREPEPFNRQWEPRQQALRARVTRARELLPQVRMAEGLQLLSSELCCTQGVRSLRADLVMVKAACGLAALAGRTEVEPQDLEQAARLVLPHRRRRKPFEAPGLDEQRLQDTLRRPAPPSAAPGSAAAAAPRTEPGRGESPGDEAPPPLEAGAAEQVFAPARAPAPRIVVKDSPAGGGVGRRSRSRASLRGREVRAVPDERPTDLALTATLSHAALRSGGLERGAGQLEVRREDLHQKVRAGRQGSLILFVVDASGSMAGLRRMQMVKGTVLALLSDAYQQRDEVGVIAFRGAGAQVLLAPTRSVETAERSLRELPTGGRTPLAHALKTAFEVLERAAGSGPQPLLIVLSDGRANVPLDPGADPWQQSIEWARSLERSGFAALVLDTEAGPVRLGRAPALAQALGAQCLGLDGFDAQSLSITIRARTAGGKRVLS